MEASVPARSRCRGSCRRRRHPDRSGSRCLLQPVPHRARGGVSRHRAGVRRRVSSARTTWSCSAISPRASVRGGCSRRAARPARQFRAAAHAAGVSRHRGDHASHVRERRHSQRPGRDAALSLTGAAIVAPRPHLPLRRARHHRAALEQSYWVLAARRADASFLQPRCSPSLLRHRGRDQLARRAGGGERAPRAPARARARDPTRVNQLVIEDMNEGVLVLDRGGRVVQQQPQAQQLLGTERLLGASIATVPASRRRETRSRAATSACGRSSARRGVLVAAGRGHHAARDRRSSSSSPRSAG